MKKFMRKQVYHYNKGNILILANQDGEITYIPVDTYRDLGKIQTKEESALSDASLVGILSDYEYEKVLMEITRYFKNDDQPKRMLKNSLAIIGVHVKEYPNIHEAIIVLTDNIGSSDVLYHISMNKKHVTEFEITHNYAIQSCSSNCKENKNRKRMYSVSQMQDMLAISIRQMVEKYHFSNYQYAYDARRIIKDFLLNIDKRKCNNYIELWHNGINLEEALSMYPYSCAKAIKKSYENYHNGNNITLEPARVVHRKWDAIINESKIDLAKRMSDKNNIRDFSNSENCSDYLSVKLLRDIQTELAREPLYLGFGVIAYDEDKINERIYYCRNNPFSIDTEMDLALYDSINCVADAYKETFDSHVDIIHGKKEIPENVPEDLRDFFISLTSKRFSLRNLYEFTESDRDLFDSLDYAAIARRFVIRYNKLNSCRSAFSQWKKKNK